MDFETIKKKKSMIEELRPLDKGVLSDLHDQMLVDWIYNSNAIGNSRFSLEETRRILYEDMTIAGRLLREHLEVVNHKNAVLALEAFIKAKMELSEDLIFKLHRTLLSNINHKDAGKYRRAEAHLPGAAHILPHPLKVGSLMEEFFHWYQDNRKMPILELAGQVHHRIMYIYPFAEANGRLARILMNFIIMRQGFPPAIILFTEREKYFRVLRHADVGEYEHLNRFVYRAMERSLIIYYNALSAGLDKSRIRYISLAEATKYCSYSQEYLSLLARQGKLEAVKFGRNWMTTKEAVEQYKEV